MSIDARIPLLAAQGAQFNLADLLKQQEDRQYRQQTMELQREQIDWARELKGIELDKAKAEAAKAGLKDMAAAVQWADTPEKWAQVQQHYAQYDPQLAAVPFEARENALIKLGQMGEYLKNTQPDPAKSSSFLTELDALGIPRDSQAAKDLFFGKNSPAGYLLKPNLGGGDDNLPTVSTPEEAKRLAPGTRFKTPDGRIKRVPGGGTGNGVGGF